MLRNLSRTQKTLERLVHPFVAEDTTSYETSLQEAFASLVEEKPEAAATQADDLSEHNWYISHTKDAAAYDFTVTKRYQTTPTSTYLPEEKKDFFDPKRHAATGLGKGLVLPQYQHSVGSVGYNVQRNDKFYVPLPRWDLVSTGTAQQLGGAFGRINISTGKMEYQFSLSYLEAEEVCIHEHVHFKFQYKSEQQVRDHVRSVLGTENTYFHYWL